MKGYSLQKPQNPTVKKPLHDHLDLLAFNKIDDHGDRATAPVDVHCFKGLIIACQSLKRELAEGRPSRINKTLKVRGSPPHTCYAFR